MPRIDTSTELHPTRFKRVAYYSVYFVAMCMAMVAVLGLFFLLEDQPFGIQTAAIITYTGAAYWLTFCRTRWYPASYTLKNSHVRQQLPRLFPALWLEKRARGTLFSQVLILVCSALLAIEVDVCRRILNRAVEADKGSPTPILRVM